MTAFIIVLIVFLIACGVSSAREKNKIEDYKKKNTSSVAQQYEIACNIIEPIAEMYREEACKQTKSKYFQKYNEFSYLFEAHHGDDSKWEQMYKAIGLSKIKIKQQLLDDNIEISWLCFTALACGISLNGEFHKQVYSKKIWENLPKTISNEFVEQWQNKYPKAPKDRDYLTNLLKLSALYKHQILYKESNGSYSKIFDNNEILEAIAVRLQIPTNEELKAMGRSDEYFSDIQQLARHYSCFKIREMGYAAHTYMNKIRPEPIKEEQELISKACTPYEKFMKNNNTRAELNKKYPKF